MGREGATLQLVDPQASGWASCPPRRFTLSPGAAGIQVPACGILRNPPHCLAPEPILQRRGGSYRLSLSGDPGRRGERVPSFPPDRKSVV